jgi:predicted Zn-dependent protease with MMP-like domain
MWETRRFRWDVAGISGGGNRRRSPPILGERPTIARCGPPPHIAAMSATVSADEMELLAQRVLRELPQPFREHCADIVLHVEDFATADQLSSVGLIDRWELSGLYEGRPVPEQSVWESGELPPRIWLFRLPLVAEMRATRVSLQALVRHVVIHEAGHHFGFSDAEMHAIEEQAALE